MCRCVKGGSGVMRNMTSLNLMRELRYLAEMRELMAGPNLPKRKSVYDMTFEELEIFRKEVKEWKNTK